MVQLKSLIAARFGVRDGAARPVGATGALSCQTVSSASSRCWPDSTGGHDHAQHRDFMVDQISDRDIAAANAGIVPPFLPVIDATIRRARPVAF